MMQSLRASSRQGGTVTTPRPQGTMEPNQDPPRAGALEGGGLTGAAAVQGQSHGQKRGDGWSGETWHKGDLHLLFLLALNLSLVLPIDWIQWEVIRARDSG